MESKAGEGGYRRIAGIDESGRGPLAGPVVAACVILKKFNFSNRIDDSKRLTPKSRLAAYEEIIKKSIYNVAVVGNSVIDAINIYNSTRLVMEKAYIGLKYAPDYVLVDGNIKLSVPCDNSHIIGGDGISLSIACASIIAKVYRDRIMDIIHKMYPRYGFNEHKGYGTERHMQALRKYGPTPLHRYSFSPIKEGKFIKKGCI